MDHKLIRMLSILAVMAGVMAVLLPAESSSGEFVNKNALDRAGNREDEGDIFADSAVVDLGNHRIAYFIASDEMARDYGYENWIVLRKLDQGWSANDQILYVPTEGIITALETDDFGLQFTEKAGQEVRDISIPICFLMESDFVEMLSFEEEAVLSAQPAISPLPEAVWTEEEGVGEEKYEISFERISIPYSPVISLMGGKYADYRLTVRTGEGKVVQELVLRNFFILYEDIYWLIDIDGDGFRDLIFCADHFEERENSSTLLVFLIWNKEKKVYEEKPLTFKDNNGGRYLQYPTWNMQEKALMFTTQKWGNYWARGQAMYRFDDGEWQLYARLIPSSDEKPPCMNWYEKEFYYKTLDYYYVEERYESGEMTGETVMEENPVEDKQSVWYREREEDTKLYPQGIGPLGVDIEE